MTQPVALDTLIKFRYIADCLRQFDPDIARSDLTTLLRTEQEPDDGYTDLAEVMKDLVDGEGYRAIGENHKIYKLEINFSEDEKSVAKISLLKKTNSTEQGHEYETVLTLEGEEAAIFSSIIQFYALSDGVIDAWDDPTPEEIVAYVSEELKKHPVKLRNPTPVSTPEPTQP